MQSGLYSAASAVVWDALRLFEQQQDVIYHGAVQENKTLPVDLWMTLTGTALDSVWKKSQHDEGS